MIAWWSERTKELVEVLWTSSISHWSIGDSAKLLIAGVEWTKLRGLSGGLIPSISRHPWRPPLTPSFEGVPCYRTSVLYVVVMRSDRILAQDLVSL